MLHTGCVGESFVPVIAMEPIICCSAIKTTMRLLFGLSCLEFLRTCPMTISSSVPRMAHSALDLIGNTPLLELSHFDIGPCRLFVKLENQNPGGSIKDRVALSMINAAERDGKLQPGGTIVEATAGNTGLGLAQVAILKGYRIVLVVPDKMAREKILHLRALGADVRMTRSDVGKGHPEYYQDMAEKLHRRYSRRLLCQSVCESSQSIGA